MRMLEWWRRPTRDSEALLRIERKVDDMALNLEKLKAAATKITNASDAMQAMLKSVAEDIRKAGVNEAELDQIANALEQEADEITAATLAGTPADPAKVDTGKAGDMPKPAGTAGGGTTGRGGKPDVDGDDRF